MQKQKILIIDDEVDYCMIMKTYFQAKNYEVFLAYTLRQGLKLLQEVKPDILLLDNNLPDGKGWDCVNEIVEQNTNLKIYLISAYRQKSEFLHSSPPNVTVWEKPISLRLLDEAFGQVV
jgi:DNA-binding response OmpR family regulator